MLEINNVYLGDCLDLMKKISNKFIDCILCDLPYQVTACSWDNLINLDKLWTEYNRIIKDNCPILLFASQPFTTTLINSNAKNFKYIWYWNKDKAGNFATAKFQPLRVIEEVVVFGKGSIKYNPQMEKANNGNVRPRNTNYKQPEDDTTHGIASKIFRVSVTHDESLRYPKNLINIKSTEKECNNLNRLHPTQKPISLLEYLIKSYTKENDLILDSCMGAGSTCVAAKRLNRNFIGMEKEEKYFQITKQRLNL